MKLLLIEPPNKQEFNIENNDTRNLALLIIRKTKLLRGWIH